MYADTITGSMRRAMDETARRRSLQQKFNEEHGIIPKTIKKDIRDTIESVKAVEPDKRGNDEQDTEELIAELTAKMYTAAENLDFEEAARLRDRIKELG